MTAPAIPVLLVGNFLSHANGSRGICEELAQRLPAAGCAVVTTSSKPCRRSSIAAPIPPNPAPTITTFIGRPVATADSLRDHFDPDQVVGAVEPEVGAREALLELARQPLSGVGDHGRRGIAPGDSLREGRP